MSVFLALVVSMSLLSTQTATAQTAGAGLGVVQGTGTISPGLTALPTLQIVQFSGTVTGAFAGVSVLPPDALADLGTINCTFSGKGDLDNYAAGQGTVDGDCSGTGLVTGVPIKVTCTGMIYIRLVTLVIVVALKCTILVNGITVLVVVLGTFNFRTSTTPPAPVTSYNLEGAAVAAGANA